MSFPRGDVLHRSIHISDLRNVTQTHTVNRDEITCFRCGENGHYKSECLNWKTKMCWHGIHNECIAHCPYAHDEAELRVPWAIKCVRIVKSPTSGFVNLGCGSSHHTYRTCPCRTAKSWI